jgi:fructokinase
MVQGKMLHGLLHPEMSHIRPPHDRQQDPFEGVCPHHKDCLEGLAAGPAIEARWKQRGETLPDDHPAWPLEAHYLALGLASIIFILSPQRIILGGGVLKRSILLPMIRRDVQQLLNNYIQRPAVLEEIDAYIVPPQLGDRAGVLGAIVLAKASDGS